MKQRFLSKYVADPKTGCWNWVAAKDRKGYGQFRVEDSVQLAHRVSWQLFRHIPIGALLVCHSCDNPSCVNPEHLFLGTDKDNMQDAVKKGRIDRAKKHRGTECYQTHLTEEHVLSIRNDTRKLKIIASEYGISMGSVGDIRSGRTWKHLP